MMQVQQGLQRTLVQPGNYPQSDLDPKVYSRCGRTDSSEEGNGRSFHREVLAGGTGRSVCGARRLAQQITPPMTRRAVTVRIKSRTRILTRRITGPEPAPPAPPGTFLTLLKHGVSSLWCRMKVLNDDVSRSNHTLL